MMVPLDKLSDIKILCNMTPIFPAVHFNTTEGC